MNRSTKHALVVPLFGALNPDCLHRLNTWFDQGFLVVVVNNNPPGSSLIGVTANVVVSHHNKFGLAGGLNAGVASAVSAGANFITLLDQDSVISSDSLSNLAMNCGQDLIVGPRVFDQQRRILHSPACHNVRILIGSGTTFKVSVWRKVGTFHDWMEIDYIDHEWCSRARRLGLHLSVISQATLYQSFGSRHPNELAHRLGMQSYSPYRRAIALRNLRWLVLQSFVPLDIRLKELVKMLVKPFFWFAFESCRRRSLLVLFLGLTAPLKKPFPRHKLEAL